MSSGGTGVRVTKAETRYTAIGIIQIGPNHAVAVLGAHGGDATLVTLTTLNIQLTAALARYRVTLWLIVQRSSYMTIAGLATTAT